VNIQGPTDGLGEDAQPAAPPAGRCSRFRQPSAWHMAPLMFLFTFCFAMYEPSLTQLIVARACKDLSSTDCNEAKVTGYSAHWMTYTSLANSILPALIAGSLGVLSDKYGRRLPMVVSTLGGMFQALAVLCFYYFEWPFYTLVIAGAVHGLMGGPASMFMAMFSFVADCSSYSSRSLRFSLLAVLQYLGILAGNMTAGVVIQMGGFAAPFWPIAFVYLLATGYGLLVPESLRPEIQVDKLNWKKANVFGAFSILFKPTLVGHPLVLLVLAVALAAGYAAFIGFVIVLVLYAKQLFGWDSMMIAYFASAQCAARAIGVMLIAPLLFKWRKNLLSPGTIVVLGLLCQAIAYAWYAVATTTGSMFIGTFFEGLSAIALPTMRSIFSRAVSEKEQGQTLASISAIETLVNSLVPAILMGMFGATNAACPRCALYVIVGLSGLAALAGFVHALMAKPLQNESKPAPLAESCPVRELPATAPLLLASDV
jgi:MFS transporter, DHA1 family, tetracycline resistance protein